MKKQLTQTFEVNGKAYRSTKEALDLLTKLNNEGKDNAASMVFNCALVTGAIKELA